MTEHMAWILLRGHHRRGASRCSEQRFFSSEVAQSSSSSRSCAGCPTFRSTDEMRRTRSCHTQPINANACGYHFHCGIPNRSPPERTEPTPLHDRYRVSDIHQTMPRRGRAHCTVTRQGPTRIFPSACREVHPALLRRVDGSPIAVARDAQAQPRQQRIGIAAPLDVGVHALMFVAGNTGKRGGATTDAAKHQAAVNVSNGP
jgi:hypothetical protein